MHYAIACGLAVVGCLLGAFLPRFALFASACALAVLLLSAPSLLGSAPPPEGFGAVAFTLFAVAFGCFVGGGALGWGGRRLLRWLDSKDVAVGEAGADKDGG